MPNVFGSKSTKAIGVTVGILVVVALMIADTTFLSPEDAAAVSGPTFTPAEYVEDQFPAIAELIIENATDLVTVANAVADDPERAGAEYGISLGAGRYVYQVTTVATVDRVDDDFIHLTVPDMPPDSIVRIPLTTALSGTPVRDATGTITFGDFVDQTDYQSVANEFKLKLQSDVLSSIDPPALVDQEITVYGAVVAGAPAGTYFVQPVSIEVAS
jgi:predicted lipoprotein